MNTEPQYIPFADLPRQRWQNNGGWTREIARSGGGVWDWRISVADVESDGPFSLFPGVERELLILSGDGVALDFADGRQHRLTPRQPRLRFKGEAAIHSRLLGGAVRDFNLMWRRDSTTAQLDEVQWQGARSLPVAADQILLLFVRQGEIRLPEHGIRATAYDSLLWTAGAAHSVSIEADQADILLAGIGKI
ncbi:environmental stress-induced protein Ves [Neisseria sp. HSC-16F19]|nr:HutD family protein [Neisseria sp. HSC-16F19]MCP2040666.1 environmental stress-induced protein Ves [Neisseria sp. HSC-16F19]